MVISEVARFQIWLVELSPTKGKETKKQDRVF
jgi:mRNA-degrading endonuclease toxin of MazEF toxin-antitoxin module